MVFNCLLFCPLSRFKKNVLASSNLSHLFLQKDWQKPNKLYCFPLQYGVLRTFFESHNHAVNIAGMRQQGIIFVMQSTN
jgi:hypothetical protein